VCVVGHSLADLLLYILPDRISHLQQQQQQQQRMSYSKTRDLCVAAEEDASCGLSSAGGGKPHGVAVLDQ
jgi:hypothetical protein